MIRLIASDLDGTLLDEHSNLPKDFFEVFDKLNARGIPFLAASGRAYPALKSFFEARAEQMDFICDNGATLVSKGRVIDTQLLDMALIHEMVEACDAFNRHLLVVLCDSEKAYHRPAGKAVQLLLDKYYGLPYKVKTFREVKSGITKLTINTLTGSCHKLYDYLEACFGHRVNIAVSGERCVDVMKKGVSKGAALRTLQETLGVSYDETMAFGDYYNDIEMLGCAKYSFVMENANPDMRRFGNYIAKSNKENGVLETIREIVLK